MSETLRAGIIGVGNMGTAHFNTIKGGLVKGLEMTAVCDVNPARLAWAKEQKPDVLTFDNADDLFAAKCCDMIIVATPHYDHPPLVIKGLQSGHHMMSEKPAGVYTKAVREMNEVAAKSDKLFGIMFNQRTFHLFRKMKELVENGTIGNIKRTSWLITDWYRPMAYYNSGQWRATWAGEGGGVLLNQCPHNLDLWQWICGMPSKVRAFCHEGKWHDIEVEDDVTAYVEYPNGATGVFITSTADWPGNNRFEVLGDMGKMVFDKGQLTVETLDVNLTDFTMSKNGHGFGHPNATILPFETDGKSEQHKGVLQAFTDAILYGSKPIADGSEGINGLTLSNAMHLSSWLDKTIELPLDEELFLSELNKRRANSRLKVAAEAKVLDTAGTYNV